MFIETISLISCYTDKLSVYTEFCLTSFVPAVHTLSISCFSYMSISYKKYPYFLQLLLLHRLLTVLSSSVQYRFNRVFLFQRFLLKNVYSSTSLINFNKNIPITFSLDIYHFYQYRYLHPYGLRQFLLS